MDDDLEYILECMEWVARHKAQLDQQKKWFEDQYPMRSPWLNRRRLEIIEEKELELEIHEYELGGFIKDYLEKNK